jgi:Rrf2 family protein
MISQKSQNGLKAIVSLAAVYGQGTLQAKEISKAQNIPVRYLELLLSHLRKAQLVDATRGKKGGYFLTVNPNTLSVYDVIKAFDGNIVISDTMLDESDDFLSFWKTAESIMKSHFKSIKIADIMQKGLTEKIIAVK